MTMTPKQQQLKAIHGTPEEFRYALIRALGDISIDEASAALAKYQKTWNEAGTSDQTGTSASTITEADVEWKRFAQIWSVVYGDEPMGGHNPDMLAFQWFRRGRATVDVPPLPSSHLGPTLTQEAEQLLSASVRALLAAMDNARRAAFIEALTQEHRHLSRIARNSSTRPSKKDFVGMIEGDLWRCRWSDTHQTSWALRWQPEGRCKWAQSTRLNPEEVERFYDMALSVEEARQYEGGIPFLDDADERQQ